MKIEYKGNHGILIEFEDDDTDTEKRIVEQGVALLRNIVILSKEKVSRPLEGG
jgi:hypothetical protein